MSRVIVLGAGGRAGRRIVAEARERGHAVTAAVRDPGRYDGPGTPVRADALDPASVAAAAAGHDIAVCAVYDDDADPRTFFPAAGRALAASGAGRLVWVSLGSLLETAPGVRVMDDADFPAAYRAFAEAHLAGLDALRRDATAPWVAVAPPPVVLDDAQYEALAVAVLDAAEATGPGGELVAVGPS